MRERSLKYDREIRAVMNELNCSYKEARKIRIERKKEKEQWQPKNLNLWSNQGNKLSLRGTYGA